MLFRRYMNHGDIYPKTLSNSWTARKERYNYFRREISAKAKAMFVRLLSLRGFTGKLKFDHVQEEIHVKVSPLGSHNMSRKDPKSLSGGEKSFTQICLLLSVWEGMGSPIVCLDELWGSLRY